MTIRNVLSIAGSDPSGGAGIQADLKAFSARGTYGMAALTALTAQNTQGVTAIHALPPEFVRAQIEAIFADIRVDSVKIGMIANAQIARTVAELLETHAMGIPIVLDPVMVAKGGAPLLASDAGQAVIDRLLPLASVITPNLPEAAVLLGENEAKTRAEMASQATGLLQQGPGAVLIKGGHLASDDSPDVLVDVGGVTWFEGPRTTTRNTHGTGCTLSSAIAAELAKGRSMVEAVKLAKAYLAEAINAADTLSVGSGHGPVNHFVELWEDEVTRR
ncbi:bifunctional hydroxymethylpyrimidine kinase/phosphomethylpyrimidine kinase [Aliirhizobium cellulosilyticum]|jgi:hydroxymethylpyrimidine/phosphomethylpyrimidine kinase|uniref:hydroxymethylpyrimidine kinase n=1 Tax=Aliirhizobium cellulosilyticum TaxID=393664 RepID=A0A7W6S5X1_9HYPH|nr:bifunctional hydroxymethylpyrimidine kinase/phosphomethylpyrimidine kinase [Rhizobium cellulosilyticum]MBB4347725.1 hydroxymethylpyrimidine/phosphomethylpyrimidine kinase [Rhizobium cellulosilyticum]MBB4409881.1 hydroxymethylpyrimidine/phosphomethylpyrimidine kinase [Rhizobium cellulosilyticum]MBB4444568.1 hydroxymethylpyrimidine/phosphomethylpyrimidine kinase [Rhizobium cellulosilyticum]